MKEYTEKKWIVFGAGKSEILRFLMDYHKQNIIALVDNDRKKIGTSYYGIVIESPEILRELDRTDTIVMVTTFGYWDEISTQLNELGWENNFVIARRDIDFFKSYEFMLYIAGVDTSTMSFTPNTINLELSALCNCRCEYCAFHGELNVKKGQKKLMSWDVLKRLVDIVKQAGTFTTLNPGTGGELFVNPEWFEMIQYYVERIPTQKVTVTTNGMLLNEENMIKLSQIKADCVKCIVSIDGNDSSENDRYRVGSKYEVIKNNIRKYKQLKKEGKIEKDFQIVIRNGHIINKEKMYSRNNQYIPLETEVPQWLIDDFSDMNIKMYANPIYIYYDEALEEQYDHDKMLEVKWPCDYSFRCTMLFNNIGVGHNGDIQSCSCGLANIVTIGNIFEDDMISTWTNHPLLAEARKHFIEGTDAHDMCEYCPLRGMGRYYLKIQ